MHVEHLERLQPVCPGCRAAGRGSQRLVLSTILNRDDGDIREGILHCPHQLCQREHPIVDGIPIVVADAASWASHQLDGVLRRTDLSPVIETVLGDAAGPASNYDRERQNLGAYSRGHWSDFDPDEPLDREGSLPELIDTALALLQSEAKGVWLDFGCSIGRGVYELADETGDLAVGIDLSFSMLRLAEQFRLESRASFALKRVGLVYGRREFAIPAMPRDRMSFWCCDAGWLPFAEATFAGALSLNVIDCVPSPLSHLVELGRVIAPGGHGLLATPFDWSAGATQLPHWIGGHSQRGPANGSSVAELRRILSPDLQAGIDTGLTIGAERDGVPWRVYTNERAAMHYRAYLARLDRKG